MVELVRIVRSMDGKVHYAKIAESERRPYGAAVTLQHWRSKDDGESLEELDRGLSLYGIKRSGAVHADEDGTYYVTVVRSEV